VVLITMSRNRLQIYAKTKQRVNASIQPCMNCAFAVKSYGADKLMKVCRTCRICDLEASDTPVTRVEKGKFQNTGKK
jgi:hypothetical protein